MMKTMRRVIAPRALLVLAMAGAVAACDNPVGEGDLHADAVRVQVVDAQSGQEVASATSTAATGSLTLRAGSTRELTVNFLDASGRPVSAGEAGFSLRATVVSTGVARFDNTGSNAGRLTGVAPGSTSVTFDLMHGGHPDFSARAIPITVTQ